MRNSMLVSMAGPDSPSLQDLSDVEAGIAALVMLNNFYPGITFAELDRMMFPGVDTMGKKCTGVFGCIGSFFSDSTGLLGRTFSDAGSKMGEWGGDLVRLFTDKKVIDGASRIGAAYASGGASEAAQTFGQKAMNFLSNLGSSFKGEDGKTQAGMMGLPGGLLPWAIAGGVVLVLLFGRRAPAAAQ